MWQGKRFITQNQPNGGRRISKTSQIVENAPLEYQSINKKYPSKLISQLMDSDSQNQQQLFPSTNNNNSMEQLPPPLIVVSQAEKQNLGSNYNRFIGGNAKMSMKQNKIIENNRVRQTKQIKFTSYKLSNIQKPIDYINPSNNKHYNSINLQQASIIPDTANQFLLTELQKHKQQTKQIIKQKIAIQNENKALKRQINLLKQQMETKDNIYQQLENKLVMQAREKQRLQKKILSLEIELEDLKQKQAKVQKYNSKKRRGGQLSKYIDEMMNKNIDNKSQNNKNFNSSQQNQTKRDKQRQKQTVQKTYKQITSYLIKIIKQLKDKLMQHRMSKSIQEILEQFMTQIININQITVSRSRSKSISKPINYRENAHTPTRNYQKICNNNQNNNSSVIMSRSSLFRDMNNRNKSSTNIIYQSVTPPKQQQKQRSQQLRNLQKSLHKLKQMEKSFVNQTPNNYINNNSNHYHPNPNAYNYISKESNSFNSLDRSSIIGLDRSKSRRKKIFQ